MASRIFSEVVPRVFGLLVFLGGVGMDVFVFQTAHRLYELAAKVPAVATSTTPSVPGAPIISPSFAQATVTDMSSFLRQIILLLLMCIAGSLVASLGVKLFFAVRPTKTPSAPATTSGVPQP
jgi:hypothetical protein